MTSKVKPKISTDMGLSESTKNIKFLDHPSHEFIQSSFDSVFARFGASFKNKESAVSDDDSTRVQNVESRPVEENLDELDFGLGLSHESTPSIVADEGFDLGGDADMELSLGDNNSFEESSAHNDDELILGDDLNLDDDVMAKLAEIDEIMEADATNTMLRPNIDSLDSVDEDLALATELDSDEGFSLSDNEEESGLDLSSEEGFSLGDENDGGLDLSTDSDIGGDFASDDGLSLGEEGLGDLNAEIGDDLEGEGFELSADGEMDDSMFSSPLESSAPKKKVLPHTPKISETNLEEDEEEEFSFTTNVDQTKEQFEIPPQEVMQPEMPKGSIVAKDGSLSQSQSASSPEERSAYKEVVGNYNHELERLQATLNHLRMDREGLVSKITELEEDKRQVQRNHLSLKAELDEKKIEIQIMKKRMGEESQDLKYQFELEQERRKLAEEKAKAFQAEAINMQQKVKLEIKKVSSRERELEQKLELLKVDAETQIRHRDMKILELKRKIDTMEFDIDTLTANEQRNIGDKGELEDKLDKAIKTLRAAIGILETDDPKLATLEKLKKNLDV